MDSGRRAGLRAERSARRYRLARGFRGEAWYGRAATTLALTVAQRDGAAAARLVDELEQPTRRRACRRSNLPASSPPTGPTTIPRPQPSGPSIARPSRSARSPSVTSLGSLVRPRRELRSPVDAAVAARRVARQRAHDVADDDGRAERRAGVDASVLNAFASADARQRAVLQVVQGLAFADPARARDSSPTRISLTQRFRAQAEARLRGRP